MNLVNVTVSNRANPSSVFHPPVFTPHQARHLTEKCYNTLHSTRGFPLNTPLGNPTVWDPSASGLVPRAQPLGNRTVMGLLNPPGDIN